MKVIVDGSNVLRYGQGCNVLYVEAMFAALEAKGVEWFAFFDANCVYLVTESCPQEDLDLFVGLLNKYKEKICIIPGGTQADDYILQKAERENACVVSNDRYRPYAARYPWVVPIHCDDHTIRRVYPFLFAENQLQIAEMSICWSIADECEVRRSVKSGLSDEQLKSAIEQMKHSRGGASEKTTAKPWNVKADKECPIEPIIVDDRKPDSTEESWSRIGWDDVPAWLKVLGIGCAVVGGVAAVKYGAEVIDGTIEV